MAGVTVCKGVERIDRGFVVVVEGGRNSERGSERSPSTVTCSVTEESRSWNVILNETVRVEIFGRDLGDV